MPAKFVIVDRDTPLLLPPDLRDWIPEDDMVHFVIEAINGLKLKQLHVNERGSGSPEYPPRMMLALLIYCYANGIFSSRKIEKATYRDIAVRYLTADTHPDHDTIAAFRRKNPELVAEAFEQVLLLARELKLLKVGRVSIDSSHIQADASKDKNVTYERAGELIAQLELDIVDLLKQAEAADQSESEDGSTLPEELARREKLKSRLEEARAKAEARAHTRHEADKAAYAEKVAAREKRAGRSKGGKPKAPPEEPVARANEQINLTDDESRIMRKSQRSEFKQCYSAQAVVDNESMLIVGQRVSQSPSDKGELVTDVKSIPESLGHPEEVLADSGYASEGAVKTLEAEGIECYVSVSAESTHRHRHYDYRPRKSESTKEPKAVWRKDMKAKLTSEEGHAIYKERFYTVEPVFGIIKEVMGFRQFSLRGLAKVSAEWGLVSTAYNLKRLHRLKMA